MQQREGGAQRARNPHAHPESRLEQMWHMVVEGLAAVGTVLIGVLMLIICADIFARNSMGASLPLVSEAGALLVVLIVALQLAATVRANRLARTEFFIVPFAARYPRAGALLAALFGLVAMGVLGMIAWGTVRILGKDFNSGEFIGIVGIASLPTWPVRLLILIGFAVAATEFLLRVIHDLRRAWAGAA
ncbi:MAG: TRAP transporter small permease [Sulfitobacter sp.]